MKGYDAVLEETKKDGAIPLYLSTVEAGFLTPTEDFKDGKLDLNQHLITNPPASFFVRVKGDSMVGAGIYEGSLLLVDRSIEAVPEKIIIAVVNGEMTVKRLKKKNGVLVLSPENPAYSDIEITPEREFSSWGVVTAVINKV